MTLADWRDLSLVLLVIEAFFISLVPGILLFFAVRGMLWVIRKLRQVAPKVQGYFRQAATITEKASQRVAAPVIATNAALAHARHWQLTLLSSLPGKKRG